MKNKVFIIAEIGTMHGGSTSLAMEMIREAKKAGADAVKFQIWTKPFVKKTDKLYKFFEKHQLSERKIRFLFSYADITGIEMFASAFDKEAVDLLEELGVKRWKIASRTVKDDLFLTNRILSKKGIKYVSFGMSKFNFKKHFASDGETVMHCVSKYPTPAKEANLIRIHDLMLKAGTKNIGYSDHTDGIVACIAAVAMGATVIEKHIMTYGCDEKHPDYSCSIMPYDFKAMVDTIRLLEKMQ